jgi:hypothetical protein
MTAAAAMAADGFTFHNAVGRWDVQHYITIANQGYENPNDMAFFPGLPLLLKALNNFEVPMEYAGVLLSLLASGIAAAALGRMYGSIAAVLWLIAPTAVFTTVGYTEALFCAAAFWAWERGRAQCWPVAAGLAALASIFRISGLFLWGALGLLSIQQSRRSAQATDEQSGANGSKSLAVVPFEQGKLSKDALSSATKEFPLVPQVKQTTLVHHGVLRQVAERFSSLLRLKPRVREYIDWQQLVVKVVWLLLPLVVLGGYMWYLHYLTGSWTAWWDAQQIGWGRTVQNPWNTLLRTIEATHSGNWPGRPEVPWVFRAEIASMALGLMGAIVLAIKRRWSEFGWIAVQLVAFGTSVWYISVNRAVLLWFPLFGMAATVLTRELKNRRLRIAWRVTAVVGVAASFTLMIIWGWLFYTAQWCS